MLSSLCSSKTPLQISSSPCLRTPSPIRTQLRTYAGAPKSTPHALPCRDPAAQATSGSVVNDVHSAIGSALPRKRKCFCFGGAGQCGKAGVARPPAPGSALRWKRRTERWVRKEEQERRRRLSSPQVVPLVCFRSVLLKVAATRQRCSLRSGCPTVSLRTSRGGGAEGRARSLPTGAGGGGFSPTSPPRGIMNRTFSSDCPAFGSWPLCALPAVELEATYPHHPTACFRLTLSSGVAWHFLQSTAAVFRPRTQL